MQALPGGAAQLAELTLRPLRGRPAALRWAQFGGLRQLQTLSLTADFSRAGPEDALGQLTALTRLRLAGPLAGRPQHNVTSALLACTAPGLARLELARLRADFPPPLVHSDDDSDGDEPPGLMEDAPEGSEDASGSEGGSTTGGSASGSASEADEAWLPALAAMGAGGDGAPPLAQAPWWRIPLRLQLPAPEPDSVGALLAARWPRLEHVRFHDCSEIDDSLLYGGQEARPCCQGPGCGGICLGLRLVALPGRRRALYATAAAWLRSN